MGSYRIPDTKRQLIKLGATSLQPMAAGGANRQRNGFSRVDWSRVVADRPVQNVEVSLWHEPELVDQPA
jgi:hypothetical protein